MKASTSSASLPQADVMDGIAILDNMETLEVQSIIGQVKDITNQQKIDIIFVNTVNRSPFLVGHEMGHVLSNNGHYLAERYSQDGDGCVNINNLGYPDPDFTNPFVNQNNTLIFNLMRPGTSMENHFFASKRVRIFQGASFREATDIPQ